MISTRRERFSASFDRLAITGPVATQSP